MLDDTELKIKAYDFLWNRYGWKFEDTFSGTQNNNVDAFRHGFAMAYASLNVGATLASSLGWFNEALSDSSAASQAMDNFNNNIGIHLGEVIKASTGSETSLEQIADVVYAALSNGDFAVATNDGRIAVGSTKYTPSNKDSSLTGSSGEDSLNGSNRNDTLSGGGGYDTLNGAGGKDSLSGGDGGDKIYGMSGNDTIKGGKGYDIINGGSGDDKIYGESGIDILYGELGNDIFVYESISDSSVSEYDVIMDFSKGDKIDLSKIDANTKQSGDQAFTFNSGKNDVYQAASVTLSGQVYSRIAGDVTGDGLDDFMIYIMGKVTISASDIIL